ncbi:MAG: hypothetical protein VW492_18995, partial [Deltaproteobacteria bacterium]
ADNTTSSTVTLSFYNVMGASHYFATDDSATSIPSATATGWRDYPSSGLENFTLTGTGMREVRVWFRDEAGNVSKSQSATIDLITPSYAYSGTIDWGTSTNYLGVTVYTVDKGFPAKGTLNAYENFCLSQGQNYISGSSHPGNGADYNSNGDQIRFAAAQNYYINILQATMPQANYDSIQDLRRTKI